MDGMRHTHGPQRVAAAGAAGEPTAAGEPDGGRRSWALMVVLSVAQFMVILASTADS